MLYRQGTALHFCLFSFYLLLLAIRMILFVYFSGSKKMLYVPSCCVLRVDHSGCLPAADRCVDSIPGEGHQSRYVRYVCVVMGWAESCDTKGLKPLGNVRRNDKDSM